MDTLIFISIFFVILPAKTQANTNTNTNTNSCLPINCANDSSFNIQFPFRLEEFQPQHCGVPGFELYCKQNNAILHFPSYGDLVINSISYDLKRFQLLDPKNCVPEVFLNLNLSHTPFSYFYILKEYQYLNCSAKLSASFMQVPCLSGFRHHVYVAETSFVAPDFCDHIKNVKIPFSYSPFLSDNTFGLGLTWKLPNYQDNEATELISSVQEETGHHKKVLLCFAFVVIVVMMFNMKKVYFSKKLDEEKEEEDEKEFLAADAFLGDYEALEPKRENP